MREGSRAGPTVVVVLTPAVLGALIDDLAAALERRRSRDRIADAAETVVADGELRTVLTQRR